MDNRISCKIVLAILGVGCLAIGLLLKKKGFPLIAVGLAMLAGSALV